MKWKFYSRAHKKKLDDGWRQLEDNDIVQVHDIIWANSRTTLGQGCISLTQLLDGSRNHLVLIGNGLYGKKPVMTKELFVAMAKIQPSAFKEFPPGYMITKRTYSIWRKKLKITKRDWQSQPLPLP
jgi:hypothetical protein